MRLWGSEWLCVALSAQAYLHNTGAPHTEPFITTQKRTQLMASSNKSVKCLYIGTHKLNLSVHTQT